MKRMKTIDLVLIAVFSSLVAVFSLFSIPNPISVPLTLQTFIIALSGFVLGSSKGVASVLVYIAVGTIGAPVFTGFQGGFSVLFGMTGGFIMGFIPLVFLCGIKTDKLIVKLLFSFAGIISCHACGVLWFSRYSENIINAFLTSSFPYVLKDLVSVVLAMIISKKIITITQKFN